jgi:hypothetical protein
MLTLSFSQSLKLNESSFKNFVSRMMESLQINLELEHVPELIFLTTIIQLIINEYSISDEELIEDVLLCYFEFPEMQNNPLPGEISEILYHRTKNERLKVDELKSLLFCQTN